MVFKLKFRLPSYDDDNIRELKTLFNYIVKLKHKTKQRIHILTSEQKLQQEYTLI